MPCDPNENNINISAGPSIPIFGFGIPISPIQLPIPFEFPKGFPEDLLDLINSLTIPWPGANLKPNLDDLTNNILKALASLFNQIAPFLSIYNFFQALLNMILCVLEVICAIPNPFKMRRAIKKLFKRCLPDFLKLFPWAALLAMILALILLILALIEYILNRLAQLLNDLLANLEVLSRGLSLQDDDSIVATTRKIASLLCLIEDLMAIFTAIAAIIEIINSLANIAGRGVCTSDSDCCGVDTCPPFIANSPTGIHGLSGELIYHREVETDAVSIFGISPSATSQLNFPPLRNESWQFVNQAPTDLFYFQDIITEINDNIFYPEGVIFTKDTKPTKAPYTIDATLKSFNPTIFHPSDTLGIRDFVIKNLIIASKPYIGVSNFENVIDSNINSTGTAVLAGGLVYEADGSTPYLVNNIQGTIETFIHFNSFVGAMPNFEDGYFVSNIEFTWNINYDVLIGYNLITLGCEPSVAQERTIVNTQQEINGLDAIGVRIPNFLPNVAAAQACVSQSIVKLRQNLSPATVAIFQSEATVCLNQLKQEGLDSHKNVLIEAVNIFNSTFTLNPDIQFTTRPIIVNVQLKDANNTIISTNIPPENVSSIESLLAGNITFGDIGNFEYDGYNSFNAEITSEEAGSGEITISFNNNTFKKVLNTNDDNTPTVIENNALTYRFIGTSIVSTISGAEESLAKNRRDESDIAGNRS